MAHQYEQQLKQCADALQMALEFINETLPPEMAAVCMGTEQALKLQISKYNRLLGYNTQAGNPRANTALPPLTSIMGQPIVYERAAVSTEQLKPTDHEKEKFMSELNDFYNNFPSLSETQINALIQSPGGEVKVRALAQKVGIADYKSRPIDVTLIEDINTGISALAKYDAEMKAAAKMLEGDPIVTNPPLRSKKK